MPTEDYSSLEVLQFDHQANAPERVHAKYPPELDKVVLAPQPPAHTGPQVAFSMSPPEVLGDSSGVSTEKSKSVAFPTHWLSRRMVLLICTVSAAVAVIVAVSIRFGPRVGISTSLPEPGTATQTVAMSVSISFNASSPKATAQPTGGLFPPHGILNDSALAAVELANGERRVFFQENSGNIREAVYLESSKQWSTNPVVSDAKMHTPLAAAAINQSFFAEKNYARIHLFYISANNSLSSATWTSIDGWNNTSERFNKSYTSATSRQLSASLQSVPFELFLLYENSNGNLTILRAPADSLSPKWFDDTERIRDHLPKEPLNFGAPFSSFDDLHDVYIVLPTISNDALVTLSSKVNDTIRVISGSQNPISSNHFRELDLKYAKFDDCPRIIWINSSSNSLAMSVKNTDSPDPPFPFSRLAVINLGSSKEYTAAVYHQITNDVLVENLWSRGSRIWIKSNITIPTS